MEGTLIEGLHNDSSKGALHENNSVLGVPADSEGILIYAMENKPLPVKIQSPLNISVKIDEKEAKKFFENNILKEIKPFLKNLKDISISLKNNNLNIFKDLLSKKTEKEDEKKESIINPSIISSITVNDLNNLQDTLIKILNSVENFSIDSSNKDNEIFNILKESPIEEKSLEIDNDKNKELNLGKVAFEKKENLLYKKENINGDKESSEIFKNLDKEEKLYKKEDLKDNKNNDLLYRINQLSLEELKNISKFLYGININNINDSLSKKIKKEDNNKKEKVEFSNPILKTLQKSIPTNNDENSILGDILNIATFFKSKKEDKKINEEDSTLNNTKEFIKPLVPEVIKNEINKKETIKESFKKETIKESFIKENREIIKEYPIKEDIFNKISKNDKENKNNININEKPKNKFSFSFNPNLSFQIPDDIINPFSNISNIPIEIKEKPIKNNFSNNENVFNSNYQDLQKKDKDSQNNQKDSPGSFNYNNYISKNQYNKDLDIINENNKNQIRAIENGNKTQREIRDSLNNNLEIIIEYLSRASLSIKNNNLNSEIPKKELLDVPNNAVDLY